MVLIHTTLAGRVSRSIPAEGRSRLEQGQVTQLGSRKLWAQGLPPRCYPKAGGCISGHLEPGQNTTFNEAHLTNFVNLVNKIENVVLKDFCSLAWLIDI